MAAAIARRAHPEKRDPPGFAVRIMLVVVRGGNPPPAQSHIRGFTSPHYPDQPPHPEQPPRPSILRLGLPLIAPGAPAPLIGRSPQRRTAQGGSLRPSLGAERALARQGRPMPPEKAATAGSGCARSCGKYGLRVPPRLLPARFLIVLSRARLIGAFLSWFFLFWLSLCPFVGHSVVVFLEQGFVGPSGSSPHASVMVVSLGGNCSQARTTAIS